MKRLAAVYLTGILALTACGTDSFTPGDAAHHEQETSSVSHQRQMYGGYDRDGLFRTCDAILPQTYCTMIYGPDEVFAASCRDKGFKVFQCGCHDYLCSEPIATER